MFFLWISGLKDDFPLHPTLSPSFSNNNNKQLLPFYETLNVEPFLSDAIASANPSKVFLRPYDNCAVMQYSVWVEI